MKPKSILGVALIVTAACLAGGGFYAAHSFKQAKFDPETLCPAVRAKTTTLILIDKTDPLAASEQSRARDIVTKARDSALRGNRITVTLLRQREGTDDVVLDTIVDLCNPGAEANPLFENPRRVATRYQNAFLAPIDAALTSVAGQGSAPASPIAHSIRSLLDGLPETPGLQVKLILISDLMEHGPNISAYASTLDDAALRRLMAPSAQAQLKGADVQIFLLPRPRYRAQQNAAVEVWRRFFNDASGRDPILERL
jgi:hypothetical protein